VNVILIAFFACIFGGCATRPQDTNIELAHYKPTYEYRLIDGTYQKVFTGPCWMDPDITGP
jgi:hypothetical protein